VRQAGALFETPAFQNLAATLGCHACSETMSASTLDAAGLIGTFHQKNNEIGRGKEREGYAAVRAMSILRQGCG